uniref:Uncharacterized protein n=1 Tax=Macrostomum lignano TaxID=282301 RepID=A0A1I8I6B2_9PLAT
MVCEIHFSDTPIVKRLIGVTETCQYLRLRSGGNQSNRDESKQTFLSGWETGVDSQLTPRKVVYTIRNVSNKRELFGSLYYGKNSGRVNKPFAFIHSLEPEAYLKYYADEHTYLANLFVQPSVQRLTACLIAPSTPPALPQIEPSATPPPRPLPQVTSEKPTAAAVSSTANAFDGVWSVAKKYSLATGGNKSQTRIQGAQLSEPTQKHIQQTATNTGKQTASNLSQQVDLLTKPRGDISGDRQSDRLSLISAEMQPVDQLSASTAAATAEAPAASRPRVSTPDRARLRDFTCAGFAPALQRRLELLAAAEAAVEVEVESGADR